MSERVTANQKKVLLALPPDGSVKSDYRLAFDAFVAISSSRFTQILNGLLRRQLISGSQNGGWQLTEQGIALAAKLASQTSNT